MPCFGRRRRKTPTRIPATTECFSLEGALKAEGAGVAMLGGVASAAGGKRRKFQTQAMTRGLPLGANLTQRRARIVREGALAVAVTWVAYAIYVGLIHSSTGF